MLKKILVKAVIMALGAIAPTATTYTSNVFLISIVTMDVEKSDS